jgi:hypothetical protein
MDGLRDTHHEPRHPRCATRASFERQRKRVEPGPIDVVHLEGMGLRRQRALPLALPAGFGPTVLLAVALGLAAAFLVG